MIGMPSRIGKASLAPRETSSCFSTSDSSGPLVSGQTRISRSFGSIAPAAGRSGVGVVIEDSRRVWTIVIRHGRACPGHPDQEGTAVLPNRDRRDKPGDDNTDRLKRATATAA